MLLEKETLRRDSKETRRLWEATQLAGQKLGLNRLGIADPRHKPDPVAFDNWLASGAAAGMDYLSRHRDIRLNPELFLPGVKSILSVAVNYSLSDGQRPEGTGHNEPRISRYAVSRDYHRTIKDRLHLLLAKIKAWVPGATGRVAVDSAPVMERHWAERAGLGWLGHNGCLIVPGLGSWVFLGEIFLDLPLPIGSPIPGRCGDCRRCLEACPSQALAEGGICDSRNCVSYWTIEHRGDFSLEVPRITPWLFGCDTCQEVCPWNRQVQATTDPDFQSHLAAWAEIPGSVDEWIALEQADFDRFLSQTAMERSRQVGLVRNARRLAAEANS